MADQIKFAAPDANGMRWAKGTSKKGASYQWGFKDTGNSTASKPAIKAAEAPSDDGGVDVNWPVEGTDWITTSEEVQEQCDIDKYYLCDVPESLLQVYSYQLGFNNTGGWSRDFTDEGGDVYSCTTALNGDHYIQYNSSKPTIVHVS